MKPNTTWTEEVRAEFIDKIQLNKMIEDIGYTGAKGTIADFFLSKFSARLQEIEGELEKEIKEVCQDGGFNHSHNPFNCGETQCTYCKHIDEGKCKNPWSSDHTEIFNEGIDTARRIIKGDTKEYYEKNNKNNRR